MGVRITASLPRPPHLLHLLLFLLLLLFFFHIPLPRERERERERDSDVDEVCHLLPLSVHLATNRGDSRLCRGRAACADLICKEWHSDEDSAAVVYCWQNPCWSMDEWSFNSNIRCLADISNGAADTPPCFIPRPWRRVSHLSCRCLSELELHEVVGGHGLVLCRKSSGQRRKKQKTSWDEKQLSF